MISFRDMSLNPFARFGYLVRRLRSGVTSRCGVLRNLVVKLVASKDTQAMSEWGSVLEGSICSIEKN